MRRRAEHRCPFWEEGFAVVQRTAPHVLSCWRKEHTGWGKKGAYVTGRVLHKFEATVESAWACGCFLRPSTFRPSSPPLPCGNRTSSLMAARRSVLLEEGSSPARFTRWSATQGAGEKEKGLGICVRGVRPRINSRLSLKEAPEPSLFHVEVRVLFGVAGNERRAVSKTGPPTEEEDRLEEGRERRNF